MKKGWQELVLQAERDVQKEGESLPPEEKFDDKADNNNNNEIGK